MYSKVSNKSTMLAVFFIYRMKYNEINFEG